MVEVFIVLVLLSISTSVLGNFLVLKNMSMLADAIAHSVLLGIVLALFIKEDPESNLVLIGASLFGVITVLVINYISRKRIIKNDDAIGVVFPIFFSIAIILININFRNAHVDTEAILMGEVLFVSLNSVKLLGLNIPIAVIRTLALLIVNLTFVISFYNNIKLSFFDEEFSKLKGIKTGLISLIFVILTSVTTVISFEIVGSILVLSLFVTPSATASLYTRKLKELILLSIGFSILTTAISIPLAFKLNVSISGMIAFIGMIIFLISLLINKNGVISKIISNRELRKKVNGDIFLLHIHNHIKDKTNNIENKIKEVPNHFNWDIIEIEKTANSLIKRNLIEIISDEYTLTNEGRKEVSKLLKEYKLSFILKE